MCSQLFLWQLIIILIKLDILILNTKEKINYNNWSLLLPNSVCRSWKAFWYLVHEISFETKVQKGEVIYASLYNLVSDRLSQKVKIPWPSLVYFLLTLTVCLYSIAFGLRVKLQIKSRTFVFLKEVICF